MSLLNSFQIGLSGLTAHSKKLSSVSDNIANANNNGFKSNRMDFEETLQSSMDEQSNPTASFAGVKQGRRDHNMTQGQISRSDSSTDMAISGQGFFEVETDFGKGYTRDGSFNFNEKGELVNGDGHKVMGYTIGANGQVTKNKAPITVNVSERGARGTSEVSMRINLDIREDNKEFDPTKPYETSNFQRTVKVFDNQGQEKYVTLFFTKQEPGNWKYNAMMEGQDTASGEEGSFVPAASGNISFDEQGKLSNVSSLTNSFNFKDAGEQTIEFDFGQNVSEGEESSTQYGLNNLVNSISSDGNAEAKVQSIGFGANGVLQTYYSDGGIKDHAQVLLANFTNQNGLKRVGDNLFLASNSSGQAQLGAPGEKGLGEVESGAIELSNVAVNEEFIEMMKAQKAFNANSKALSTADELLQKVINVRG